MHQFAKKIRIFDRFLNLSGIVRVLRNLSYSDTKRWWVRRGRGEIMIEIGRAGISRGSPQDILGRAKLFRSTKKNWGRPKTTDGFRKIM